MPAGHTGQRSVVSSLINATAIRFVAIGLREMLLKLVFTLSILSFKMQRCSVEILKSIHVSRQLSSLFVCLKFKIHSPSSSRVARVTSSPRSEENERRCSYRMHDSKTRRPRSPLSGVSTHLRRRRYVDATLLLVARPDVAPPPPSPPPHLNLRCLLQMDSAS